MLKFTTTLLAMVFAVFALSGSDSRWFDQTRARAVVVGDSPAERGAAQNGLQIEEITQSPQGRAALTSSLARLEAIAPGQRLADYKVYAINGNDEDVLIAPSGVEVTSATIALNPDGSATLAASAVVKAAQRPKGSVENGRAPLSSSFVSYWDWAGNYCFSRSSTDFGYFDTCWYINQLMNDPNGSADYYSFYQYGTAGPTGGGILTDAWLESGKHASSSTMSWVDWSPKSDTSGSCTTGYTVSVSAFGVGLSASHTRCETWDITKGSAAGSFKNDWGTNATGDRELGYITVISVPEGGTPVWWVNFSHTSCYPGLPWTCESAGP